MKKQLLRSFLNRIINRLYTLLIVPVKERKFIDHQYAAPLRYMFFPCKESDVLLVGFQACNPKGARYNYVKTLRDVRINRLFIKDDFAPGAIGSYYLGKSKSYDVEQMTFHLIEAMIRKTKAKHIVFIGSSKGGYAALNFGLRYPDSVMIIAAPQYHLADYLNCEKFRGSLEDIVGANPSGDTLQGLNNRLKQLIAEDPFAASQRVYIHYSDSEHTYAEHVAALLRDLSASGAGLKEDVGHYSTHEDLRYFFPSYLRNTLTDVIESF